MFEMPSPTSQTADLPRQLHTVFKREASQNVYLYTATIATERPSLALAK